MARTNDFDLHDHSGIRWFAPTLAVVVAVVIGILLMLSYPHLAG